METWHDITTVLGSGVEFGFLNALMVLGLALAFRFGNFPDLTIEGTVTISAATSAVLTAAGVPPLASIAAASVVGILAGMLTSALHILTGISRLLSGIIMMTVLYALSLHIMNGSNCPLFGINTFFSNCDSWTERVGLSAVVVVPLSVALVVFLHTEFGLLLRANGENQQLVKKLGRPCWVYLLVTLSLANCLVSVSGSMVAQSNRFADAGLGAGTIITGLAALLLGEAIIVPVTVGRQVLAAIVGSVIYYTIYAAAIRLGLHPWDLKLASGIIVLAAAALSKFFVKKERTKRIGCDPL